MSLRVFHSNLPDLSTRWLQVHPPVTITTNPPDTLPIRLHLYGTYEQGEEEEGEVYEVLNIRSLKQATPNLRVINLWGVRWQL